MANIVLVDDESGQLEIMAKIILDLYSDFNVVTFDNSIKALEYIRINSVDAVLSDIKMPVMDGLELSEQIIQIKPDIIIAIISAYSDFNYAQRAINFGVIGYLIKPVSHSKIIEIIDKINQQINIKSTKKNQIVALSAQLENYEPVYIEKQLKDWLIGNLDDEKNNMIKSLFKWNGPGLVVASKINVLTPENNKAFQLSQLITFCKIHLKKLLSQDTSVLSVLFDEQQLILISVIDSRESISLNSIVAILNNFVTDVKAEYNADLKVGVSEISEHIIDNLHTFFKQALGILDYTFLITAPLCLTHNETQKLKSIDDTVLYSLENKILDKFRSSNVCEIKNLMTYFCKTYSSGEYIASSHMLREHFLHIAFLAKKHVQYNINDDIIVKMNSCTSMNALAHLLIGYLEDLINFHQKKIDAATKDVIESIKRYIDSNPEKDITLELIADIYHFNPSYISNLFKSYSQVGFKEYLISMRIEKAKCLLRDTNLKVYEIAKKTGYCDVAYFVKLFKKEVGISPNKFRNIVD